MGVTSFADRALPCLSGHAAADITSARGVREGLPGVVDTTAARVEHPNLVAERLLRSLPRGGPPYSLEASHRLD